MKHLGFISIFSASGVAFARDSWEMQRVAQMSGLEMVFLTATIVTSDPGLLDSQLHCDMTFSPNKFQEGTLFSYVSAASRQSLVKA